MKPLEIKSVQRPGWEIVFRQARLPDDEIKINVDARQVFVNNKALDLTKKEYDLLLYFISNKNRVISKSAIAQHLWGDDMDLADNYDFIYTHIKNLRKKLVDSGGNDYIKTINH